MSMTTLSNQLVTKIQGMSGVNASQVFDYDDPKQLGFPCITVTMKEWTGKFLDTFNNERIYIFAIRVYQDVSKTNTGPATAESNLRTLADNIVASFDNDNKLGGTDIYTEAIGAKWGWVQNEPIRYIEIEVRCHDVVAAVG